jgi:hypothetical protein
LKSWQSSGFEELETACQCLNRFCTIHIRLEASSQNNVDASFHEKQCGFKFSFQLASQLTKHAAFHMQDA